MNLGVLVSGRGSNLQAIIDSIEAGRLKDRIALVICDREGAQAIDRCVRHGIPYRVTKRRDFDSKEDFERALVEAMKKAGVELIVLAGFMRVLSPLFLRHFPMRVINIHPSLIPAFQGMHAQRQALEYGAKISGCSVHFVTEELDNGPVIAQACVPVLPEDTEDSLSERILAHEHRILPQVIRWISEGRVRVEGRKVVVEGAKYGTLPFNPELEHF
ncbi:MAG: phosphoribosylglycinamide formyltransferase [Aquificaceae bacterium]|uniref:phosphoribosylglycinamide formyltransferase n=1 Tax=Hydrogenobacter sp. Uz 6-8 TaxID=3384828 RepID=UPI000F24DEE2|nr:MAG: phosphoribosylglycinamide formyltransferase [Aquificota bacterium]